mgnify:CR=1 FL=1
MSMRQWEKVQTMLWEVGGTGAVMRERLFEIGTRLEEMRNYL